MLDFLVAATPPVVTALLAALGVWLRRRFHDRGGQRAAEDARARISLITSMLDAYRGDPTRSHAVEEEQLLADLAEAYRRLTAAEATARPRRGRDVSATAATLLLLDRRATSAAAKVFQVLYYLSLAWALLWLAAAVLFGLAIAFGDDQGSFGVRLASSFGVTVLALAVGLAPSLVLLLLARTTSQPRSVGAAGVVHGAAPTEPGGLTPP